MAAAAPPSLGPPPGRYAKFLDRSPGPAQYNSAPLFGSKKGPHLYSFTGKPRLKREYPTPDPAKYSSIENKPSGYSFSMAGKFRVRDKEDIPGPGKYFDDKGSKLPTAFGSGPKYSLSGRHRVISKPSALGPGSHNIDNAYNAIKAAPPAFSLAKKFHQRDKLDSEPPGPGKYDLNVGTIGKNGIKVSLSGRHRLKREHETPGPAHYPSKDYISSNSSPRFTFGNSKRTIEKHWATNL